MKVLTTLAAIVIAAVTSAVIRGQDENKANEVLAAARKTIGEKKIAALKTFSVEASVQRNAGDFQVNADVELLLDLPDKYSRSESVRTPGAFSSLGAGGFNGDKPLRKTSTNMGANGSGTVVRMGGPGGSITPGEKVSPEQQEKNDRALVRSMRFELSRMMLGWFAMAHPLVNAEFSYAGEAESPQGKMYVIDAKNNDGFAARLFVDEQTHLPLMVTFKGPQPRMISSANGNLSPEEMQKRMEQMRSQPPTMIDYTTFFEDWRDVDGLMFPHKMRRVQAGTTTEEWTVSRVRVNPKIDAKKFQG